MLITLITRLFLYKAFSLNPGLMDYITRRRRNVKCCMKVLWAGVMDKFSQWPLFRAQPTSQHHTYYEHEYKYTQLFREKLTKELQKL